MEDGAGLGSGSNTPPVLDPRALLVGSRLHRRRHRQQAPLQGAQSHPVDEKRGGGAVSDIEEIEEGERVVIK